MKTSTEINGCSRKKKRRRNRPPKWSGEYSHPARFRGSRCSAPIEISSSGGPIFRGPRRDELPPTIPLAYYSTEDSKNAPRRGTMIGTPAIFAAKFGAGRVVAISPHPKSTKGAEFLVRLAVLATRRAAWNRPRQLFDTNSGVRR